MNLLLVATLIIPHSIAFYACSGPFCPSLWTKTQQNIDDIDEAATIYLGQDKESGCLCRQSPKQWTICFGRELCSIFPKNLNITTKAMRLKATKISELKPGDLVNVEHLQTLEVDGNFNLSKIRPGTFSNMTKLTNLSISSNAKLTKLEKETFEGLSNLVQLSLVKNGFINIIDVTLALSKKFLPRLVKLELSQNNFIEIYADDFEIMKNSSLEELNLILCQIEYIHSKAFAPLTNLKALRLGENGINITSITKVVEKIVELRIPLNLLNLYSVGFRKTPPKELLEAISQSNVTWLNLARNQFEVITSESFPFMPKLEVLDLREILVLNITNDAFAKLPRLKVLLLSGNRLSCIPEGVLLKQLIYLDLQDNSGNQYSYFSVFDKRFTNMKNLKSLNLGFNRINAVYNTSFVGLINLTVLGLRNGSIFHISNGSFVMLSKLVFLNLENNHFAKNKPMESTVFQGLANLEVLLLGGCGISFIYKSYNPFENLTNLKHLGLERNKLFSIQFQDFNILPQLQSLDLSENNLQSWQEPVFVNNPNFKVFIANDNKFIFLSAAMWQDFTNLTKLEVRENPFTCDCTSFWAYQKMKGKQVDGLLDKQEIFCGFPDTFNNLTLSKFLKTRPDFCTNFPLIIILFLILIIIVLIVSTFLLYYYRWHLRYWVFLTRLYFSRKGKISNKKTYTNYIYDAFVSYSNEDRNFVIRLVTMLENYPPYIKLCVYERDFEVGSMISENVLESVAKSRKTLLVISDSYAKSQWCRWESQIAEHHRLFFHNENGEYVDDSLIMIKLGPVSEFHLTPTLKFLLKTRIYLEWNGDMKKQKVFWERLRGVLAPPQELIESTYL